MGINVPIALFFTFGGLWFYIALHAFLTFKEWTKNENPVEERNSTTSERSYKLLRELLSSRFIALRQYSWTQLFRINISIWATAQLCTYPSPKPTVTLTYWLIITCWVRGRVGAQLPSYWDWSVISNSQGTQKIVWNSGSSKPVQTPYFAWAKSNSNEGEQRIFLICIGFGSCEVRRLNFPWMTEGQIQRKWLRVRNNGEFELAGSSCNIGYLIRLPGSFPVPNCYWLFIYYLFTGRPQYWRWRPSEWRRRRWWFSRWLTPSCRALLSSGFSSMFNKWNGPRWLRPKGLDS